MLGPERRGDLHDLSFRARQLRVALEALPFTQIANAFNAALLAYLLGPGISSPGWLLVWTVVAVLLGCGWWLVARRLLHQPARLQEAATTRRYMVWPAVASGALYGALVIWQMPVLDADRRFLLGMVYCGMICADAFAFATVPAAAYGITLVMCACGSLALHLIGSPTMQVVMGLLWLYGAITAVMVHSMNANLRARMHSEAQAADKSELVGMLLRDFESHASDWLWETDRQGVLRRGSARMAQAIGLDGQQLEGMPLVDLIRTHGGDETCGDLARRLAGSSAFSSLQVSVRVPGDAPAGFEQRWWSLTATPVCDEHDVVVGWRGVGSDVTAARRQADELERAAMVDLLTGLGNRRRFMADLHGLEIELALATESRAAGQGAPVGVLFLLDLDNFKTVNDTLGHHVGDRLLEVVAGRLRGLMEPHDVLARLGGDEYAMLHPMPALPRAQDPLAAALAWAQTVLQALRDPCYIDGVRLEVRASLGGALFPHNGVTGRDLMRHADAALYAAKDAGRDTVRLFDHAIARAIATRHHILNDLGQALEQNAFSLVLQPQVRMQGASLDGPLAGPLAGRLCGFEALLRWCHPERGLIPPAEFIPVAEDTGLIVPIGAWVLQQACRIAARWPDDLRIAVNLSPVQFNSRGLIDSVDAALADSGLAPSRLELEITESALIADRHEVHATLAALRQRGVRVALDDFGTGYSSLAYLQAFPLDVLKIDRAFVSRLVSGDAGSNRPIVRAIVELAAALGLVTLGEGIETEEEAQILRELGCELGQGYLFGRPMTLADAERLVRDHAQAQAGATSNANANASIEPSLLRLG
jgi:diguanylate cyclase (GGDEF)-like protein